LFRSGALFNSGCCRRGSYPDFRVVVQFEFRQHIDACQPVVIPSQPLLLARDLGVPTRADARKARFRFGWNSN
jgi:hypothetical protein